MISGGHLKEKWIFMATLRVKERIRQNVTKRSYIHKDLERIENANWCSTFY
jgi:hypothetical protein